MIKIDNFKFNNYGLSLSNTPSIEVNDAHRKHGHIGMEKVKGHYKNLVWRLTGVEKVCDSCALGKARQKNLNQVNERKSKVKKFYKNNK